MKTICAFICVLLLAGCASSSYVQGRKSAFHSLPAIGNGETFFMHRSANQRNSLEHESYEKLVAGALIDYGWRPVASYDADFVVMFDYALSDAGVVTRSVPVYDYSGSTSYTTGTINTGSGQQSFQATTREAPQLRQVGTNQISHREFQRGLMVYIYARDPETGKIGRKVFEGSLSSYGSTGALPAVMPSLIRLFFRDFPGESGKSERVTGPMG